MVHKNGMISHTATISVQINVFPHNIHGVELSQVSSSEKLVECYKTIATQSNTILASGFKRRIGTISSGKLHRRKGMDCRFRLCLVCTNGLVMIFVECCIIITVTYPVVAFYHYSLAFRDHQYLTFGALEMFSHFCKHTDFKTLKVVSLAAKLLLKGLNLAHFTVKFKDLVETHLVAVEADLSQWLQSKSVIGSVKFGGINKNRQEILVCSVHVK